MAEAAFNAVTEWQPRTTEETIAKLDAIEQIRQLAVRYALALDSRNMDEMVLLFVEDVQVGRDLKGRVAMREWFSNTLSRFKDSIHFVGNHVILLESPDTARGVVYCRDELERTPEWHVGMIQYWDRYVKRDGRWLFQRRKLHRWYMVDALKRPVHGAGTEAEKQALTVNQLPDAWPSWAKFWHERGTPIAR